MSNTTLFSVVSPVYRAEAIVPELVRRIRTTIESITQDYEIILVDDGSPDKSWEAITQESKKESRVKGIQLSRNFGQHYAITAGLDHTNGEWLVVMDCDLQDKPEEIYSLYQKAKEGYDIVMAQREIRTDGFRKKFFSKIFYLVFNYLTDMKHDSSVANYGIYSRKVVNAFNQIREPNR
jgi:glycosyltransferase involved in cell wall biosynthesis